MTKPFPQMVYVLKIRRHGDDDDIFIFDCIKKVQPYIVEYFGIDLDELSSAYKSLDGLEDYLMRNDIGYFHWWNSFVR
jgi:hypothetical protein